MSILSIIKPPDPRLNMVCQPFNSQRDQQVLADLLDTLKDQKTSTSGIAAPQLGHMVRAFVMLLNCQPVIICNPVVIQASRTIAIDEEGCLSYPWLKVRVTRSVAIKVACEFPHGGEPVNFELQGRAARVFLHELDHLNGITIETHRRLKQKIPGIVH